MRGVIGVILCFICAVFVTALCNVAKKCNELEAEIEALHKIQATQIEQVEKDIRLLKTDVDIIQYGYKEEEK